MLAGLSSKNLLLNLGDGSTEKDKSVKSPPKKKSSRALIT